MKEFFVHFVDTNLGKISNAVVAVGIFFFAKEAVRDYFGLSPEQASATGAAVGYFISQLITELVDFYRKQNIRELQNVINVKTQESCDKIKVDGKVGNKTIVATAKL